MCEWLIDGTSGVRTLVHVAMAAAVVAPLIMAVYLIL